MLSREWLADLELWLARSQCLGDDEVRRELAQRLAEYRPSS
jgi:hypothetical protein